MTPPRSNGNDGPALLEPDLPYVPGQVGDVGQTVAGLKHGYALVVDATNQNTITIFNLGKRLEQALKAWGQEWANFRAEISGKAPALPPPRQRLPSYREADDEITAVERSEDVGVLAVRARAQRERARAAQQRAERAEKHLAEAKLVIAAKDAEDQREARRKDKAIRYLIVALVTLALGGGTFVTIREVNRPSSSAPAR